MISQISHNIKKRESPKDVFITPEPLAKNHIKIVENLNTNPEAIWYDPFRNSGNYYNNFNTDKKIWSEILDGKDFFKEERTCDIICSNPPYSCVDNVLFKSINLQPKIISYLLAAYALTPRRIEMMEQNGYFIKHINLCKVFKWYGMSMVVVWEKGGSGIVGYDRTIYRN
jgi:hypothetical protein